MRILALLLMMVPGLAFGAGSNVFSSARDSVRMVSAANAPVGGDVRLALEFKLAPGWHIYWSNPGDAGLAPVVVADAPVVTEGLKFPAPGLLMQAGVAAYVLSGHVVLPFAASHVGAAVSANVSWLVCADVCVPEHARFVLPLAGGESGEAGLFGASGIVASPFAARIAPDGVLTVAGVTAGQVVAARFFPFAQGVVVNAAAQDLTFGVEGLRLQLKLLQAGKPLNGVLELTDKTGLMQALVVRAEPGPEAAHPPYLLLAFLGGLILNLMPCVFPILAMKAVAIARLGGADSRRVRGEAFGYTAGVLVAMLVLGAVLLGVRAFGAQAGWGFQFQSPVFVAVIAFVIFGAALNLAGVFEVWVPPGLGRVWGQHSVLTGVLAVVVATPCTAPFMGGAVAAALVAPAWMGLGIFLALGVGLALPFLVLGVVPGVSAVIPRPGVWMVWVQRALSVPMMATFLWLGWVLFRQAGWGGVGLLVLGAGSLALALSVRRLRVVAVVALVVLPFLHDQAGAKALSLPGAEPYTAARLAALRAAGKPVFIDLTAAWCVTCLVNEATTLSTPEVRAVFAAGGVTVLVGDWTDGDSQVSALLAANGREGVPLYLYYPAGGAGVVVLPQVLDVGVVEGVVR